MTYQPWWDWGEWQYRAVVTQANGAGGAVLVDIKPARGDTMIVALAHAINSGTNSLIMDRNDEDDNKVVRYISIASAAGTESAMPQDLSGSSTDNDVVASTPFETRIFRNGDYLVIRQLGAGAQNDTLTVQIRAFLSGGKPSVTKDRSTNQGDVTIATPTVDVVR